MKEKVKEAASVVAEVTAKKKALEVTFSQIDKQFGKGAIMLLGEFGNQKIKAISTGSILIDQAIGIGGLPTGRIIEIFGPEASGKTTLALHVIAQAQKTGGICAFIDAEHALDPSHAQRIGVKIKDLVISQPDFGEQALDIVEMLTRSNAVDIIVVDSVAALIPKAELEGDMGDSHMGLQARLMSQALRKLTSIVHKSSTVLIFINQVRQNIASIGFGPKETTTGGKALKFYASVRLDVRRIASLKKNEVHIGNRIVVKVAKNKVAPPFKTAEVDLLFNRGICAELDLLDAALQYDIIKKSGSWFSYGDINLAQGREQVYTYLIENPDKSQEIRVAIEAAFQMAQEQLNQ